jgi:hypothetical protein
MKSCSAGRRLSAVALLPAATSTLEELHCALMLLGCGTRCESAEIPSAAGFWILLARIEPVVARLKLPDQLLFLMQRNAHRRETLPGSPEATNHGKETRQKMVVGSDEAQSCPGARSGRLHLEESPAHRRLALSIRPRLAKTARPVLSVPLCRC